ncbi:VWA domain-containing protein [Methylomonas sp. LL1]|uniref:VWA domain-containing protein n=1 Tax=Methylomonas sp. LL1 TaxID=2785785 RepID=UPI0018C380C5|nr:vWA domain-containing protein [Methylomonas sp. LL1]QPK65427.1 VWA domain-containing protein [Methylomonas sp. LL1]
MSQSSLVFFISMLLLISCASRAEPSPDELDEIQVLIDVSGSMKQNDPQNLRVDATQLLINLLPDNTHASLWLFAEKTTQLIQSDSVNSEWRKQAMLASKTIHSRGIYTHIEEAIQTVMQNGFTGNGNKNLILLTDGMVDISKDIMVSADSRERILTEWIPRLRQQNIKVQTIALSGQADKELLDKLAFDSGGWTETAESAEQLQHLFLKMAQKVAPRDTLPLSNNQFNIDSSIQEFSVLVFKQTGASRTQLITPDQQKISKNSDLKMLSWLEGAGYDLITIKQPMVGEWRIDAAIDPDNQVMILTDLQLQLAELANFIGEKDTLPLKLHFTEQNQLITRDDFLGLVTISLSVDHQEPVVIEPISSEPGFFLHNLSKLGVGKHNLAIVADGKTFKREIVRDIDVVSTFVELEKLVDKPNRQVTLKFLPDTHALDSASLLINAQIHQAGKEPQSHMVEEKDGEWRLTLDSLPAGETIQVNFNVTAKTLDGKTMTPTLAPLLIDDSLFTPTEPVTAATPPNQALADPKIEPDQEHAQADNALASNHWGITIAIVIAVNLLLCGIGFMVYKMFKKFNAKKQQQILERLA